ncbi:N-acetylmuramic acid 6-phosphate etherase [Enemella evansiae]|uniref:N-acetylmuramic acid 6-phosphate etherase n=1 Tax=Enemella evansiae TaxID=2016499 RepID=UPI000B97BF60|nr:N-acetylmuramic acid 6-phosphate etherase [Enemella evansiae]OYO11486.1 N-acetylmuramic acid 6-phosphate etherase [Enemella evansiae]TDO88133.1 N-acetylmuramic acid 6-phosphate etherase [Enemella evansiae]
MTRPPTEQRNPRTTALDLVPTEDAVRMILDEDARAVEAALAVTGPVAELAELVAARLADGGSLHYFGAGASGRIAMADATEATPTFGVPPGMIQAHFPGGAAALADPTIDLEDAEGAGRRDAAAITDRDVVVGISASGRTGYVTGALQVARQHGARTALLACDPAIRPEPAPDHLIVLDTGAEALTGSTRLKAGTATKVVLNALSTTVMVALGRTYGNLMISLTATNAKLRTRSISILEEVSGLPPHRCVALLAACDGELPVAVLAALAEVDPATARMRLARSGSVRTALTELGR